MFKGIMLILAAAIFLGSPAELIAGPKKVKKHKRHHADRHEKMRERWKAKGFSEEKIEDLIEKHEKFEEHFKKLRHNWAKLSDEEKAKVREMHKKLLEKKLAEEGETKEEIKEQLEQAEKCFHGECNHAEHKKEEN